jgi:hypothetical protein
MKKTLLLSIIFSFQIIQSQVPSLERDALIALYNATDGINWNPSSSTNWNTSTLVSDWAGVTVENISGQDHIVKIELASSYLNGTLPNEIGNLSELKHLEIIFNESLTGNIPASIGNLLKLEFLSFWNNNLTGAIPSELGNCLNLVDLSLENNQLTGNIPLSFKTLNKLRAFWLNGNQLSGTIPAIFSNWNDLVFFSIGEEKTDGLFNNFNGEIDLSNNNKLNVCWIYNNNISTLNIKNGNNATITSRKFNSKNNPNLTCVIVDNTSYSDTNWLNIDSTTEFRGTTQECSTLHINEEIFEKNIVIFPNPSNGIVNILNNSEIKIKNIRVINLLGQTLQENKFQKEIDISRLPIGVYYINFEKKDGKSFNYKIIKK